MNGIKRTFTKVKEAVVKIWKWSSKSPKNAVISAAVFLAVVAGLMLFIQYVLPTLIVIGAAVLLLALHLKERVEDAEAQRNQRQQYFMQNLAEYVLKVLRCALKPVAAILSLPDIPDYGFAGIRIITWHGVMAFSVIYNRMPGALPLTRDILEQVRNILNTEVPKIVIKLINLYGNGCYHIYVAEVRATREHVELIVVPVIDQRSGDAVNRHTVSSRQKQAIGITEDTAPARDTEELTDDEL